ncbi:DUF2382 domain-containing protein [Macrococcus equipercicus]|uniref:DUF2382 domain-containing protein n=1 Tax=Macrococcus equipercicus TaxID=69967 RepID=A0ABQ6R8M4_9STAP|nr:DUF2382 domain-containing protein [Macrococcus equipercicus]KAA1039495.1 DUF2382 domain-containing protein [Macrococcus equipercicus]
MRNIESFSSEQALLSRIDNLKSQGIAERDMHVISKNKLEGSALDYTDVQYKNADGSFGDKVASLFTGEDPQHRVFERLNLSDAEQNQYVREVESGNILLYVDNNATYNNDTTTTTRDHHYVESNETRRVGNTNGVVGGFASADAVNNDKGRTLTNESYGHPDDGTTGLSNRASYESDTDAQYSSHHRESNLNNREERVDMRNEFNNTNDFDRVDNDRLDNNLVGGRDGALNNDRRDYEFDEDIKNRADLSDDEKIRLHEERLRVGKDQVQTGEVRIDKDVVEERQEFDVPVSRDEVTIERRRVDERVDGDVDFDRLDNDTIRVPLTEERINVEKENVVAEELIIKKNRVQDTAHVSETVRKEQVNIDDTQNTHVDNDRLDNDLNRR